MKNIQFIISLFIFLSINSVYGQIAINTDGADPDTTALLDVQSTTKGVLLPRMTTIQKDAIASPAIGLMVYDTDLKSLSYYDGSIWIPMQTYMSDKDRDTRISVEASSNEDKIRFYLGNNTRMLLEKPSHFARLSFPNNDGNIFMGTNSGLNTNSNNDENIFIGQNAGKETENATDYSVIIGHEAGKGFRGRYNLILGYEALSNGGISNQSDYNVLIGSYAGYSLNGGDYNSFIGSYAGYDNTSGEKNIAIGYSALDDNTTGDYNISIGNSAGGKNLDGTRNISIGQSANLLNENGSSNVNIGYSSGRSGGSNVNNNVAIGYYAGYNQEGDSSIYIGNGAGYYEINSQRLYIDNSRTTTPLLYGEFDNDYLQINGTLNVNGAYTFPTTKGTNGQTLLTDGSGQLYWSSQNTVKTLALSGTTLSMAGGNSVNLNILKQTLSISGNTLSISNGNSVTIPTSYDDLGNHTATQNILLGNNWLSNDGGNEGIRVNTSGDVSIGTSSSTGKLTVSGNTVMDFTSYNNYGRLNDNGCGTSNTNSRNISIWATHGISADVVMAISDERIKNIQGLSDNEEDLQTLMQIEVTDYLYKDTLDRSSTPQKKVIAQQVNQIYPQAVQNDIIQVIPDIMISSVIENGWITLKEHDLKVGEKIKLIFESSEELLVVKNVETNRFQVDADKNEQVFVYGREVNDFHIVDYDALSMLNVSATQALIKRNNNLKNQQENLEAQLNALEAQANRLEALLSKNNMGTAQSE